MAYSIKRCRIRPSTIGDTTAIPLVANKKIRVLSLVLSADGGANNVQIKGGANPMQFNLSAGEKFQVPYIEEGIGHYETTPGADLVVNLSAATSVSIIINGAAVD